MVTATEHNTTNQQSAKEQTNNAQEWAVKNEKAGYARKKTIGEKKFDQRAYIWLAGIGTFVLTIISAFALKDSNWKVPGKDYSFREKYDDMTEKGAPKILAAGNFIQRNINKLSQKIANKDAIKWNLSSDKAKENAYGISRDAMLTSVTFFGGLIPLPFIRHMERNKAKIVRRLNEKYGTAEDVIAGEENVKDEAPQSWGSIIKGRIGAWFVVFITFAGIGAQLIPKTFGGLEKDFENIAGKVGNKIHNWPEGSHKYFAATGETKAQKEGNEKSALPAGITPKQESQMYTYKRMGNLAAVDIFATAASASLLYVISKFFAKKSDKKKDPRAETIDSNGVDYVRSVVPSTQKVVANNAGAEAETEIMPKKKHLEKVGKRNASYVAESEKEALVADTPSTTLQPRV